MTSGLSVSALVSKSYSNTFRYRVVKRGIDLALAVVGLFITLPLFPLIAIAIKLGSAGPAFYRWRVVGENGRSFVGYKFRTMVANADELRGGLSSSNERRGPAFKMKDDPRVTWIGRPLRRYSLDELPQLFSILKGDMSFVGPRPLQIHEWTQCNEYQRQRAKVRPGAISLWHVSGQPPTFDAWIALDLEYISRWSLVLDLSILGRSLGYVLSARNY